MLTVANITQITNDRKAKIPFVAPRTDGVRLYFVEGMPFNSGSGIAQVSVTGGETTFIDTSLREVLVVMDISPDRSKLLVHNGFAGGPGLSGSLWIQPLPAGAPYRVANLIPSSASFTADSAHILFGEGRLLKVSNLDGSDPRLVGNLPGIIRGPRYSPDGKVIRFWLIQPQGTARSIWEMNADGTNLHPLLPNWKDWPDQCCGNWSPDGDEYYFQARNANEQAIWVLPERRSIFASKREPYPLISGPLHFGGPSPSPDGKRLFVVGEEARVELFHYDPEKKRFDPFLSGLSAGPIDMSPDGKWVTYVTYPDQTLWRSRSDLSEKIQLTFPPMRAFAPRWSPDGSRIAFQDVQINKPWTISVISAAGGDIPKPILRANSIDALGDATWTPDGKSIIFFKAEAAGAGKSAIYRLNLESRELVQIPGSEGIFSPRISPDGRYISGLKVGGQTLLIFDQTADNWSVLAEGEAFGFNEWSHDSKYVYARASHGGSADIVRVRIKDHVMEHVVSLKDFPALVDPFANWIGVTADGGVLLMRDRSVQEIYALELARK
jgi:Tol biopolymer transport system component